MKKTILRLAILLAANSYAQNYVGFASDNYSGVHGVIANPANVVDSRFKTDINLFSLSAHSGNDYASFNAFDALKDDFDFDNDAELKLTNDNNGLVNLDALGPSFMFNINAKNAIAITTRARAFTNINNIDGTAVDLFENEFDAETPININDINLSATSHLWSEIGLTYGRIIFDKQKHFLKAGITAKYLHGHAYGAAESNDINLDYDPFVLNTSNGNIEGSLTGSGTANYSYSNNTDKDRDGEAFEDLDDYDFGFETKGIGFDFGLVYEYRPNSEDFHRTDSNGNRVALKHKNKYLLKAGLSITDIGSLKYKNAINNPYSFNGITLTETDIKGDFEDDIETKLNPTGETTSISKKIKLPAAAHLNIDWNAYKKLYLNLNTDLSLIKEDTKDANRIANTLTVNPRFETRWFTIQSPVSIREYGGTIWGAGLRLGPLFVGSGTILSNLLSDKTKSIDVYAGLKIPVYQRALKDKDGDGVIDKEDACPKEAGPASNNGCPLEEVEEIVEVVEKVAEVDTDKDGIIDSLDECPNEFGVVALKGCPEPKPIDTDNDGIEDKLDACPNTFGLAANKGCPNVKDLTQDVEKAKIVEQTISQYAKTINFNSGKSSFTPDTYTSLEAVLEILNKYSETNFLIEGYTDSVGSESLNQRLSENRALAVKAYFIEKGVTASRLDANGYGESNPIASNATSQGRRENRRVEIKLKR